MAEQRAEAGDPESAELVRSAGEEAGLALKELRDLARGIHPAILTNRGLAAALDDLAARASIPVEVTAAPQERLPDPVEAAAYFVVSECLANVDKHRRRPAPACRCGPRTGNSSRGRGRRRRRRRYGNGSGSRVCATAWGPGRVARGREPRGSRNARARDDPAGGARGPGELEAPRRAVCSLTRRPTTLQARRTRRLRVRVGMSHVAAILVLVWALTGTGNPWIVWPLLGLGLVAALDAWLVLGGRPLRESDVAAVDGDRAEAVRSLRRRRRIHRRRRARHPRRVADRHLDRVRRRLLLAGMADPRHRRCARVEVAPLDGYRARAARRGRLASLITPGPLDNGKRRVYVSRRDRQKRGRIQ